MASTADYLTCVECGHPYETHTGSDECNFPKCDCFGFLWPEDE